MTVKTTKKMLFNFVIEGPRVPKMLILLIIWSNIYNLVAVGSEVPSEAEQCDFLKIECGDCQGICSGDNLNRVNCSTYCQCSKSELAPNETIPCSVVCNQGYFGSHCEHKCSQTCWKGKCSSQDGFCTEGCVIGYFGDTCLDLCNPKCRHGICNRETGKCSANCEDGYIGFHCERKCPVSCDVCRLENNIPVCLIGNNEESREDQCFLYEVILSFIGALAVIAILVYLMYRCSCKCHQCHHQESQAEAGSPLNLSQFALEGHTPSKPFHRLSRSTGYLDEPYHEISSYTPTRTRMALRTFRFPSTRRSKSLCSLGDGRSCWVGEGEDLFELFNNSPKLDDCNVAKADDLKSVQMHDMKYLKAHDVESRRSHDFQTRTSHDAQTRKSQDVRTRGSNYATVDKTRVKTRKSYGVKLTNVVDLKFRQSRDIQCPMIVPECDLHIEDDVFVDVPTDAGACSGHVTDNEPPTQEAGEGCRRSTWKSEAKKGYISAIYPNDMSN